MYLQMYSEIKFCFDSFNTFEYKEIQFYFHNVFIPQIKPKIIIIYLYFLKLIAAFFREPNFNKAEILKQ